MKSRSFQVNPGVVSHFPAPDRLQQQTRDIFQDYGGPWAVDAALGEDGAPEIVCQRVLSCPAAGNRTLVARLPSMPLLPPNACRDPLKDTCMYDIKQQLDSVRHLVWTLHQARGKVRKGKLIRYQAEHALAALEALQIDSEFDSPGDNALMGGQGAAQSPAEERRERFEEGLRGVKMPDWILVRQLAANSRRVIGKQFHLMNVNSRYTRGCVSWLPSIDQSQNSGGAVVMATGLDLDQLSIWRVRNKRGCEMHLKAERHDKLLPPGGGRIYQTEVANVQQQQYVLCRHECKCTLLRIECAGSADKLSALTSHSWTESERPTSVSLSPYIAGEALFATDSGSVYLWSPDSSARLVHGTGQREVDLTQMNSDPWTSCHFGAHPRLGIFADRISATILDFRGPHQMTRELFSVRKDPNCPRDAPFHPYERVMVTGKHASPFYHIVATDYSVVLMDERFLKYPVLLWSHSLQTPPQYLSTLPDILPGECPDHLLLLSSQDSAETLCFQFHPSTPATPPLACGAPWRVARVDDFAALLTLAGFGFHERGPGRERLGAPLVGACAVPRANSDGFCVVQMTSFGDLFSQDYYAVNQSEAADKTCSTGPGCSSAILAPIAVEKCRRWMEEAERQWSEASMETLEGECTPLNISETQKRMEAARGCSHNLCRLCRPLGAPRGGSPEGAVDPLTPCLACRHTLDESEATLGALQRNGIALMLGGTAGVLAADGAGELSLDAQLESVDASGHTDPESVLLVREWRDELDSDIKDLLAQRDEKTEARLAALVPPSPPASPTPSPSVGVSDDEDTPATNDDDRNNKDATLPGQSKRPRLNSIASVRSDLLTRLSQPDFVQSDHEGRRSSPGGMVAMAPIPRWGRSPSLSDSEGGFHRATPRRLSSLQRTESLSPGLESGFIRATPAHGSGAPGSFRGSFRADSTAGGLRFRPGSPALGMAPGFFKSLSRAAVSVPVSSVSAPRRSLFAAPAPVRTLDVGSGGYLTAVPRVKRKLMNSGF